MNIPARNMAIIEKYDHFFNYVYPLAVNMSHKHKILKEEFIHALLTQYKLFHDAAKTNQKSKLFLADSNLAYIKEILRIMVNPQRKLLSRRQYETSSVLICEAGSMLNSWINRAKG